MSVLLVRASEIADWRSISPTARALRLVLLALGGLLLYVCITTQGFFSVSNGKAILSTTAFIGIIAIGATVVMLGGNLFSITIGTTTAISAMMFLYALQIGVVSAIVLTLILGFLIGAAQGFLVGSIGANPIIVTLGAGSLQAGVAAMLTSGSSISSPSGDTSFAFLARPVLGLPFAVYVFFGLALVMEAVMRTTVFGRHTYLLGENREAARAAALPVTRVTVGGFALASACAALAGILVGAFNQHASLLIGETFSLDAIAAVLVGGTAVTGGRGSVTRTVIGALLIGTVSDLLLLRGYNSAVQILVKGMIVLLAMIIVHVRSTERDR